MKTNETRTISTPKRMAAAFLALLTLLFAIPLDGVGITAWATEENDSSVAIDETNFPDAVFRAYVKDNFDKDNDGSLSANEIANVTYIYVDEEGISDLTGIEYFSSLVTLNCNDNQLTFLDVSENSKLQYLHCTDNKIKVLNLGNISTLYDFLCCNNQLTSLDVSNDFDLMCLDCSGNQLTSLDLSNNSSLFDLNCSNNSYNIGTIPSNKTITLSEYLPKDFDATKASGWAGASYNSDTRELTITGNIITYTYKTGYTSDYSGEDFSLVTFTLTYEEFENPLTGSGTLNDPYKISTAEELIEFSEMINKGLISGDVNAILTKDIDFGTNDESGGGIW